MGRAIAVPAHGDVSMPSSSSRAAGSAEAPLPAAASAAEVMPVEPADPQDDQGMMERVESRRAPVKRGRSKTMVEDTDEAAEKTYRIANEDLHGLAKGYQAREDDEEEDEEDDDHHREDLGTEPPAKVIKLPSNFLDRLSLTDSTYPDCVDEAKREYDNVSALDVMGRMTFDEVRKAGLQNHSHDVGQLVETQH